MSKNSASLPYGPGTQPGDAISYGDLSLEQWITKFGRIYGKRHDKHTTEYMISRLVEEVAELVNPVESQDTEKIGQSLADVFSWVCSIAYKLGIDLSDLAWEKYGGRNAPRPSLSHRPAPLSSFSQPATLREWQNLISKVYQEENSRLTPTNALVAMMKDVGDLAMLNRKRAPADQVTSKLAAILAWSLTISQLLRLDLATVVGEKYDDHCPSCHQATCDTDICHPLTNLFVSFGPGVPDEEKYAILDAAANRGYKVLVNSSPAAQNTRDLSTSVDLISRSDAACIVLSSSEKPRIENGLGVGGVDYRQVFEIFSCYAILSKGNIWIFGKRIVPEEFRAYIEGSFSSEGLKVLEYRDAGNLRASFESLLASLEERKKAETAATTTVAR